MQIIFFTANNTTLKEWTSNHKLDEYVLVYDEEMLKEQVSSLGEYLLIVDYDSVASVFNKLMAAGNIFKNTIVLEKSPAIVTGKKLLLKNVRAYGNTKMATIHFTQMMETVLQNKVWTYPQLTASLAKKQSQEKLSPDSLELIQNRLSTKEIEVLYSILDALTNNAIALKLEITTRTVKAHISSIFIKLHVNDRISLVLLLK